MEIKLLRHEKHLEQLAHNKPGVSVSSDDMLTLSALTYHMPMVGPMGAMEGVM